MTQAAEDMEKFKWRNEARKKHDEYLTSLGLREYDEIEKSNLFLLRKKVGFAACGNPSELPKSSNHFIGYKDENLLNIKKICNKIIEKSDYDPIKFSCTILILYHEGNICETPLFRIVTPSGNIFIDAHCRVYKNWDCFMKENKLPECEYCYPENGQYDNKNNVYFALSPSSRLSNKAIDHLDSVGSVASVAAGVVSVAGVFVSLAPVVTSAAVVTAVCTGAYDVSRSIRSLYDRKKHEQSVGLKDKESRSVWFSVGSSVAGMATIAAVGKAQKLWQSGKSLSKLSVFGLRALTTSSLAFSGFGFVDTLITCAEKHKKGILTKKDVFDLSCELMFLFNAIASVKATAQLINNMSPVAVELPTAQKQLTKTQKRNLRKREAKRRAKGLLPSVKETEKIKTAAPKTNMPQCLFTAIQAISPRAEEVLFKCHSISHDFMSWKMKEITVFQFFRNTAKNLMQLSKDFQNVIAEVFEKLNKYLNYFFESVELLHKMFTSASKKCKSVFLTKMFNAEDHIDAVFNEVEEDINNLYNELDISNNSISENIHEDCENSDDNDLNPELQSLLFSCEQVIKTSSLSCQDIEEYGESFEAVKFVVLGDFKEKIDNYKRGLEAARKMWKSSFDLDEYHKNFGIEGDVRQYFFNEALKGLNEGNRMYKIKNILINTRNKMTNAEVVPVWEQVTEGMYQYYGPLGTGPLQKIDLLSIISSILEISITHDNCKVVEGQDNTFLITEVNKKSDIHIVADSVVTEDNTASGIIYLIKEENKNHT